MPFPFHQEATTTPSQKSIDWAKALHSALRAKGKALGRAKSMKKWARQFQILQRDLKGDDSRISKALNWYTEHVGQEYVPVIQCGKSFREKFIPLEAAIKREQSRSPTVEVISPEVKQVVAEVGIRWPEGLGQHIPAVAEMSFRNYKKFRSALLSAKSRLASAKINTPERDVRDFLDHVLPDFPPPVTFLANWLSDRVHGRTRNIRVWKGGSVGKLVFDPADEVFQSQCRDRARHYGQLSLWGKLWDMIGQEVGK